MSYSEKKSVIDKINEQSDRQILAMESLKKYAQTEKAQGFMQRSVVPGMDSRARQKLARKEIEAYYATLSSKRAIHPLTERIDLSRDEQGRIKFNFPSGDVLPAVVTIIGAGDMPEGTTKTELRKEDMEKYADAYLKENPGVKIEDESETIKFMSYVLHYASLDSLVRDDESSLIQAAHAGRWDWFNVAIKSCDVNWQHPEIFWTALLAAVANRRTKMSQILLEKGANPNIPNGHGITPLMYAARYDYLEAAEMLLDYGANLNMQDRWGETALMVSIRCQNPKLAAYLLSKGCDVRIRNNLGLSALNVAELFKDGKTARLIRKRLADASAR